MGSRGKLCESRAIQMKEKYLVKLILPPTEEQSLAIVRKIATGDLPIRSRKNLPKLSSREIVDVQSTPIALSLAMVGINVGAFDMMSSNHHKLMETHVP